jgi:hypothetical protein
MPCNSDYMNANEFEINYSRVLCLLKEVKTSKPVNPNSSDWQGYHKKAYNFDDNKQDLDQAVKQLCEQIREIGDLHAFSLELQMWWREHEAADRLRLVREQRQAEERALADRALQKISRDELEALKKWILK